MSQSAPLPGSVFRFRPEVDEVLNPAKEKALTSIELIRGLRPQPSGRPGASLWTLDFGLWTLDVARTGANPQLSAAIRSFRYFFGLNSL